MDKKDGTFWFPFRRKYHGSEMYSFQQFLLSVFICADALHQICTERYFAPSEHLFLYSELVVYQDFCIWS